MASAPTLKIYNPQKEYVASCKYGEEAACLMAFLGNGATVRCNHTLVVWTEGREAQSASESYDYVTTTIMKRLRPEPLTHEEN